MESSSKKFVVDEGGNKRKEISSDDVKTALHDITECFRQNAFSYYDKDLKSNTGNEESEIRAFLNETNLSSSVGL
jgi:hypothetical protein